VPSREVVVCMMVLRGSRGLLGGPLSLVLRTSDPGMDTASARERRGPDRIALVIEPAAKRMTRA